MRDMQPMGDIERSESDCDNDSCPECGFSFAGTSCGGEWECVFPGRCIVPGIVHHSSECMTPEMAEEAYQFEEAENNDE